MEKIKMNLQIFKKDREYLKMIKKNTGKTYAFIMRDMVNAHREIRLGDDK